ncbi:MAG TPA: sulfotransferase domain-containing protein, partial [Dongiaceae bacterium]
WHNMLTRAKKRTDISLEDVILGRNVAFGDWSGHLQAWKPKHNRRILLVYYRDLISQPETVLERISGFVGKPRIAAWRDNFAELHRLYPEFFASGSDAKNIAQMTDAQARLFWHTHREAMHEYGFPE